MAIAPAFAELSEPGDLNPLQQGLKPGGMDRQMDTLGLATSIHYNKD